MKYQLKSAVLFLSMLGGLCYSLSSSWANELALENTPLFLSNSVAPNLVITFDDSANMTLGFFPDSIAAHSELRAAKSVSLNKMAYDPSKSYRPGHDKDGAPLPDADFSAAGLQIVDIPFSPSRIADSYNTPSFSTTIDLNTHFRFPWNVLKTNTSELSDKAFASEGGDDPVTKAQAAYYYMRNTDLPNCDENDLLDDDCYEKKLVTASEQQNFANWYQYHSLRFLKAKTVLSQSGHTLPDTLRIAWQSTSDIQIKSANNKNHVQALGKSGQQDAFYNWLYQISPQENDKNLLREATIQAGNFFSNSSSDSAYEVNPGGTGEADSKELACRSNYHLLISSGSYDTSSTLSVGDSDQSNVTLPDGEQYQAHSDYQKIFPGNGGDTLADIAFYYWHNDLRSDLKNSVPYYLENPEQLLTNISEQEYWNHANNVASWQHMSNLVLGFGVGHFDPLNPSHLENLIVGNTNWYSPFSLDIEQRQKAQVDDLWHASINSRGRYFSIFSPENLAYSLSSLTTILEYRESSVASLSATSGSLKNGGAVFQVGFSTQDWSGFVKRYPLSSGLGPDDDSCNSQPSGSLCGLSTEVSESSATQWKSRNIFTIDPDSDTFGKKGIALKGGSASHWNDLTNTQKSEISSKEKLDYVLGDLNQEQDQGGSFRNRSTAQRTLGAVVHAPPQFVGNGHTADGAYLRLYPDSLSSDSQPHRKYLDSISNRIDMLYVSANDGMVHAYQYEEATNKLTERFAYLPDALFPHFNDYSNPAFTYRGILDGDLATGDAFFNNGWHTVLVGAFRQGAKGLFALDISTPKYFDQSDVLWEYTSRSNAGDDLGFIYGDIQIAKTHATHAGNPQTWAAIVGNGYNSINGNAALLVIDIKSGNTIATIDTGIGLNESASASSTANKIPALNNGLSAPFLVDLNQDFVVDYAYAGDLYGNLWRFNLRDASPSNWSAKLIFTTNSGQPITSQPVVSRNPKNSQVMVYFGTGKYLEATDDQMSSDNITQTMYGIIERFEVNPSVITSHQLLEQTILAQRNVSGGIQARLISNHNLALFTDTGLPTEPSKNGYLGWKINLPKGERIIYQPISRAGIVIFTSMTPAHNECEAGGQSWIMALDSANGGRLDLQVFDNNNDGSINNADSINYAGENMFSSGRLDPSLGIASKPVLLHDQQSNTDHMAISGSSGRIGIIQLKGDKASVGIKAWRRLR